MILTRVGYAGGTTEDPTYHSIGDYSETVQVEYDPTIVSYEHLLAAFWNGHNPSVPSFSRQYRSVIFYTTEQQRVLATESKEAEEARLGKTVYTDIEPDTGFYVAEDYHQKYYLRLKSDVANELYAIYPDPGDFRDSNAAARLNGYFGGNGDVGTLENELDSLGLSESGKQAVLRASEHITPVCSVDISG